MISNVRMADAEKGTDSAPLKFAHEIQGTVTYLTILRLHSWIMTASVGDRSVGKLRLSGTLDLRMPTRDLSLEGSLKLTDLPGRACNPLLALWSDARIDRAHFNGRVGIRMTGDFLSWEIDLRGDQIRLRLPEIDQATVPLHLVVTHSPAASTARPVSFVWTRGFCKYSSGPDLSSLPHWTNQFASPFELSKQRETRFNRRMVKSPPSPCRRAILELTS